MQQLSWSQINNVSMKTRVLEISVWLTLVVIDKISPFICQINCIFSSRASHECDSPPPRYPLIWWHLFQWSLLGWLHPLMLQLRAYCITILTYAPQVVTIPVANIDVPQNSINTYQYFFLERTICLWKIWIGNRLKNIHITRNSLLSHSCNDLPRF